MTAIKKLLAYFTARQWSILLTTAAIVLWSCSLIQAKLNLGPYGLINSLPVSFFISLALLTLASAILWVSPQKHGRLLFLQLFFLILSMWLTPLLIGGAGYSSTYALTVADLSNSEYIMRTGHFVPELSQRLCWPGVFIFAASLAKILGLGSFNTMIAVFPFLWQFIMLLPLYLIFRNTLGKARGNYHWAALWVFYLSWASAGGLHTQTLANLFLMTLLAVFTSTSMLMDNINQFAPRLSNIILLAALTITHLLTSLFAVGLAIALHAAKRARVATLAIIGAVFITAWLIYVAAAFFKGYLAGFFDQLFRLDLFWHTDVIGHASGTPEHKIIVQVLILATVIFCLLGLSGFIAGYRQRTRNDITMIAIAVIAVLIGVLIGANYGYELPYRIFILLILPIAYFATKLLKRRLTVVLMISVLLILLPLRIVSQYGNISMDYSSPSTIASWGFFHERTSGGGVVGSYPFGFIKNPAEYRVVSFHYDVFEYNSALYEEIVNGSEDGALADILQGYPHYYVLCQNDHVFFESIYGDPAFVPKLKDRLEGSVTYNLLYRNPDVSIYVTDGD